MHFISAPTWLEFWDSVSVLSVVGWVLGILGLIAFFIKGWPRVKQLVAFVDALFSLPTFIKESGEFRIETRKSVDEVKATLKAQDTKIDQIHHEVNYNNGSSVKDAVERVELGVKGLYDRVDAADRSDAEIRADIERTRPTAPVRKRAPKPKE